ncbi:MAG: DUF4834 family protein [Coprobacter sp.]|nr:DUF4834 family protein [Coprobacter sp.]
MFQFFIFIGFIILLLVFGFIFRIANLFGGRRPSQNSSFYTNPENPNQAQNNSQADSPSPRRRKKVFDHTDGEYVDFVEVKENPKE